MGGGGGGSYWSVDFSVGTHRKAGVLIPLAAIGPEELQDTGSLGVGGYP